MDLLNEHVLHCKFGKGKVTNQTATVITVEFGEEYGSKRFVYPSAFEGYLELSKASLAKKMDKELTEKHKKEELEIKQHALEEEQRREEEERLALEKKPAKKRATTTKKATAKKPAKAKKKAVAEEAPEAVVAKKVVPKADVAEAVAPVAEVAKAK